MPSNTITFHTIPSNGNPIISYKTPYHLIQSHTMPPQTIPYSIKSYQTITYHPISKHIIPIPSLYHPKLSYPKPSHRESNNPTHQYNQYCQHHFIPFLTAPCYPILSFENHIPSITSFLSAEQRQEN